jgi:hypothetical protein
VDGVPHVELSRALDDDWRVDMRLALGPRGHLLVSEVHVTPRTGTAKGLHADVPALGITSRLLKRVPVHAHVAALAEMLRIPHERRVLEGLLVGGPAEALLDARPATAPRTPGPRMGRPPLTAAQLLPIATAYSAAVRAGSPRPIQVAAARLKMQPPRVRDLVHRCRQASIGLLTTTAQGVHGGDLTPYARTLLTPPPRATSTPSRRQRRPSTRRPRKGRRR